MQEEGGAAAPFPSIVECQMRAVCAFVLQIDCQYRILRRHCAKSLRSQVRSKVWHQER
ncbi:hypothetical protein IG631_16493 [Alternaria alternata]|nr:hypothetical protein IG631_16493 [Alternaria alternata]